MQEKIDELCVNAIRMLSVDAVEKAKSGHPGAPMGLAPVAFVLWTRFLKHNPKNPGWPDRDRFVLSAGHASMLLYSMLHLTGYEDISLDQIKQFRQWGSRTPGHPERELAAGIETTTGPLGQGFGNGVGMAIAEAFLAARYNRPGFEIINHFTYAIVSDGDLMEGVAAEAASLAGHLKLGKLIYLYDNNRISLAASTDLTFTEDVAKRFESYGWHTQSVDNGNDLNAIDRALSAARSETTRPSIILVRTHIGYGSPGKQDSFEAHGAPLGEEEAKKTREKLGWRLEPFQIPEEALARFRESIQRGEKAEREWQEKVSAYAQKFPELAKELEGALRGELPQGWDAEIPEFPADPKGLATRAASGKVLNAIAPKLATLIGGSADLNPSTFTALSKLGDFESPERDFQSSQGMTGGGCNYAGRNLHFGVREHAMGASLNGMAAHGGILPFGSTFLIFSDYLRPSMRLAALMELGVIYVFTHDSIGVGEDGPTHQPIEQLAALRAIPRLVVIRPGDANETAVAWRVAIESRDRPVALALSRQNVPTLDRRQFAAADGLRRGAYVLADAPGGSPEIILIGTGSELSLAVGAREKLLERNIKARVVSMPSWELFDAQPQDYREAVLPPSVRLRLAVEAALPMGWHRYVGDRGDVIGVERFGASAPGNIVMEKFGFTVDHVVERALALLGK
jgi:transketolase